MSDLHSTIILALDAHKGQKDLGGQHYILHPFRVMLEMETDLERKVAVLHDVVEDSDWTIEALEFSGYSPAVIDALLCLTHLVGEAYSDYITRILENELACRVKIADLKDNLSVRRFLPSTEPGNIRRSMKYRRALRRLERR